MLNNIAMQMLQKMPAFQQFQPFIQMMQQSPNPMALMQQKFGNDPAFQKAVNSIRGKNPKEVEEFVKNTFFTQTNIKI